MKNRHDLDTFRLCIICYKENDLNPSHCYFLLKTSGVIKQIPKEIINSRLPAAPGCNTTLACNSSQHFQLLYFFGVKMWRRTELKQLEIKSQQSSHEPCPAVTVGGSGSDARPQRTDWSPGSQQKPPWSLVRLLMEDSCQSCSIHVYVFLQREVGVNSGHSDQLALAEIGLLTLDSCWAVLPINLLGLSWSWCSVLSSSAAKHTATFTPQLRLSVSLGVSLHLAVTSQTLVHTDWKGSSSLQNINGHVNFMGQKKASGWWAKRCKCHLFPNVMPGFDGKRCASGSLSHVFFCPVIR